jgi:hypothetical protein
MGDLSYQNGAASRDILTVYMRGDPLFKWKASDTELAKFLEEFRTLAANYGQDLIAIALMALRLAGQQGLAGEGPGA